MRRAMRVLGIVVGGLIAVVLLCVAGVYLISTVKLHRHHRAAVAPLPIPGDSASIARGRHLATAVSACTDCHGADLAGRMLIDQPAFAVLAAPNISPAGLSKDLTDPDLVRAIRYGIAPDGRSLLVMPSEIYHYLSDDDLAAIVAYVRSLPPAHRELKERRFGPISRALLALDKLPVLSAVKAAQQEARRPAPTPGPTQEYGEYLAHIAGCISCHGPGLSGGPIPDGAPNAPPAANITPGGIGRWTQEDFTRALRAGRRPSGPPINDFMPWRVTRNMTDDEVTALWRYLRSVPPKQYGNR